MGSSQYDQAVVYAQNVRNGIISIGDLNIPEVRLILGELDVWYAHALMYAGGTSEALKILKTTDGALRNNRHQYKDESFIRWCLVLGRVHNHIGYANWMDLGHYEIALSEFHNALSYFLDGGLEEELATDYDNIGRVYAQLGYQTRAKLLIEHGRQIRQKSSNRYRFALSLNSQAIAYLNSGQPNHALNINEQAFDIFDREREKRGPRGKGLALLTKAHALRQISTSQHLMITDSLVMLDNVLKILGEANHIFEEVGEDVRRFQVNNELGCAYRDKAVLLKQKSDTESALRQARIGIDYLKESIQIAKGDGKEVKYRVYYVDACEDLAQTYFVMGNVKKASQWIEKAEESIPGMYKFIENIQPGQIPASDCYEEFWQQLGKISWLRGQMSSAKSSSLPATIESYTLASAYFGRFLERPLESDNHHLYPPHRPQLVNHRGLIEYIYDTAKDWDIDDIRRIQDVLSPEIKRRYGLKPSWTREFFDEPLGFVLQMNVPNIT